MATHEDSNLLSPQEAADNKTLHPHKESCEKMNERLIFEEEEGKASWKNDEAKDSAPKDSTVVRVCDFCGKTFNSGKALGGHRRHHLQAQKKLEGQTNNQKPASSPTSNNQYALRMMKPNNYNLNVIGNGNHHLNDSPHLSRLLSFRCSVCEKDFASEKSLYGHMRSHPERDWRGMDPTTRPSSTSSEEEESDDEMMMMMEEDSSSRFCPSVSLGGIKWGKKDMRGRKCIGAAEAAENLMLIHNVCKYLRQRGLPPLITPPPPPPQQEDDQEDVQHSTLKKRKRDSIGSSSSSPDWKEKLLQASDDDDHDDVDDGGGGGRDDVEEESPELRMTVMTLKKEAKKVKKVDKEEVIPERMVKAKGEDQVVIKTLKQEEGVKSSPTPPQRYVCDICGKSFSIPQALGGHKSRHNRANHQKKAKEEAVEKNQEEGVKGNEEGEEASMISTEERLVISSNGNDDINLSREEEAVRKASHQSGGSKMKNFDLNLPPETED